MKSFRGTVCFLLWVAAVSLPAQIHAQSEPAGKNAPLAIIDAIPITENDLNVQGKLLELENQAYQLRRRALENAISRRILEKAAAEKKLTGEELLKQEVDAKIPDPSPREVEAFYLGRKDKFRKPLPEVRQQAARMLKSLRVTEARAAYTAKLRQQSPVEILLAPMRFPVEAGDAPRRGPATAPVTIVEFSDFQCPYCKRTQATLREILARYGDQVSLVFKDLPLTRTHREA